MLAQNLCKTCMPREIETRVHVYLNSTSNEHSSVDLVNYSEHWNFHHDFIINFQFNVIFIYYFHSSMINNYFEYELGTHALFYKYNKIMLNSLSLSF